MNQHVLKFDAKPREERDFKEIYPDLDEQQQLRVFVRSDNVGAPAAVPSGEKSQTPQPADLKKPSFKRLARHDMKRDGSGTKFAKILTEYGFQDGGSARGRPRSESTYNRPFQLAADQKHAGVDSIEKLLERKKNQVEYDMDEQDYLYLKQRNEQAANVIKITPEVFEIVITTLENEWGKLEHRMNTSAPAGDRHGDGPVLTLDHATSNDKYGNDDGIVPGSLYDQKCAVCNDSDCDNSNAIVFCDGCDIAVHQECYGIAFIPEGSWLCRKCMINKNRDTRCSFCPSRTGAFKQLDNSLWSHVVCALWINELYFANPVYMEPIEGMDLIPKSRWKLVCYLCKQRTGACIQCTNRSCFQAYHVTCAKRAGLYMEYTQGIAGAVANKLTLATYCDRHSPAGWDGAAVARGISRTRRFYHDTRLLHDQNARLAHSQKTANKLNVFKWRTENNTPIAPQAFSDTLFAAMVRLKVEHQVEVPGAAAAPAVSGLRRMPNRSRDESRRELRRAANELCRYWCLKREAKRGAPLIRKNNNLMTASAIATAPVLADDADAAAAAAELARQVEVARMLVGDLARVEALATQWGERQRLAAAVDHADLAVVGAVYFPLAAVMTGFLDDLGARYDPTGAATNYRVRQPGVAVASLQQIVDNVRQYRYGTVQQLRGDVEALHAAVVRETRGGHHAGRALKRWMAHFAAGVAHLEACERRIGQELTGSPAHMVPPFVGVRGGHVELRAYDGAQVLADNDLSEVEDDDSPVAQMLMQRLLQGK